jgi:hypothetical protein
MVTWQQQQQTAEPENGGLDVVEDVSHQTQANAAGARLDAPGSKAGSAAIERITNADDQSVWEDAFGTTVGDLLYKAVAKGVDPQALMKAGEKALDSALLKLATSMSMSTQNNVLGAAQASALAAELTSELRPIVQEFMESGAGAKLANGLSSFVDGSPYTVVSVLVLAAAVAIASGMTIPELSQKFNLGDGFSAKLIADLGTFKKLAVQDIGAQLEFKRSGLTASVRIDRLTGNAATAAMQAGGVGGPGGFGTPPPAGVVDALQFKLDKHFGGTTGAAHDGADVGAFGNATFNEGHFVSGSVGVGAQGPVGDGLEVRGGVSETIGQTHAKQVSVGVAGTTPDGGNLSFGLLSQVTDGSKASAVFSYRKGNLEVGGSVEWDNRALDDSGQRQAHARLDGGLFATFRF